MDSCNQQKRGRRPWSKSQSGGSLVVEKAREKGWNPPRSQLGGSLITTTKKEQAWSTWASSNSTQKLYQHHNHLSPKKKKTIAKFW